MVELLDIDELHAAVLVNEAASKSSLIDRSISETAVYLYHSHRQRTLECIRIILLLSRFAADVHIKERIEQMLATLEANLKKLHTNIKSLNDACLQSIEKMKQGIEAIVMSERKEQVLQGHIRPTDVEFMKNRKQLHIQDMEFLGVIMTEFVLRKSFTLEDFRDTLGKLQQVESMNYVSLSLLPCVAIFICKLFHMRPSDIDLENDDEIMSTEAFDRQSIKEVCKVIHVRWEENCWQMRRLGAMLYVWVLCGANGACQVDDLIAGDFQFERDIKSASLEALQSGAFDALMTDILIPLRLPENEFEVKMTWINVFSQKRVSLADIESFVVQNQLLRYLLFDTIEVFVECVITKLTFLLRDTRLAQEDRYLTQQAHSYELNDQQSTDDLNTFGLEIFFSCLSCLTYHRSIFSNRFLSDVDTDLYGFLAWASSCATSSMISSYSDFLGSLATSQSSASKVHDILLGRDRKFSQPISSKQIFSYFLDVHFRHP